MHKKEGKQDRVVKTGHGQGREGIDLHQGAQDAVGVGPRAVLLGGAAAGSTVGHLRTTVEWGGVAPANIRADLCHCAIVVEHRRAGRRQLLALTWRITETLVSPPVAAAIENMDPRNEVVLNINSGENQPHHVTQMARKTEDAGA